MKGFHYSTSETLCSWPGIDTVRLFCYNLQIILGWLCLLCSTLNFLNLHRTAPGIVRPATLVSCLPQLSSQFKRASNSVHEQSSFKSFAGYLDTANQYIRSKSQNLIPANCNLAFLQSFFFELRSEVMTVFIMQQYPFYHYNGNYSSTRYVKCDYQLEKN